MVSQALNESFEIDVVNEDYNFSLEDCIELYQIIMDQIKGFEYCEPDDLAVIDYDDKKYFLKYYDYRERLKYNQELNKIIDAIKKGLNKAIDKAHEKNNIVKSTIAEYLLRRLDKVNTIDDARIILKNAARSMHHKNGLFASKTYMHAKEDFEKARILLQVTDDEWNRVLTRYHKHRDSDPQREYQTYKFYKKSIDLHQELGDKLPLMPHELLE
ncbi:MAG: hypothetical protein EP298_12470 [Gammaproteobacteria bacterium]|nr:MAG: hypothetical protein EP298_12470 [Gammaproteobacteria bacterium]UTW41819.1 hypothetical protein KFE69_09940 [bacterium SCSIO 12844]